MQKLLILGRLVTRVETWQETIKIPQLVDAQRMRNEHIFHAGCISIRMHKNTPTHR
jgi:hypothetical protein